MICWKISYYIPSLVFLWCSINVGHLDAKKVVDHLVQAVDIPRDVIVVRGNDVSIKCGFRHPMFGCGWRRNDTFIPSVPRHYIYKARLDNYGVQRCDIRIIGADAKRDSGLWTCVTYGNETFNVVDMPPAKLTVIEAVIRPDDPVILFDSKEIMERLSQPSLFSEMLCVSRRGNPSAKLHWELINADDGRVVRLPDDPKQSTMKIVQEVFNYNSSIVYDSFLWLDMVKHRIALESAREIKCIAEHPAYGVDGQRYVSLLEEDEVIQDAKGDLVPVPQSNNYNGAMDMLWTLWATIGTVLLLVILLGLLFHCAKKRNNRKIILSNGKTTMTNGQHESFTIMESFDDEIVSSKMNGSDDRQPDDEENNVRSPTPPFPPPPPPLPPSPSLKWETK